MWRGLPENELENSFYGERGFDDDKGIKYVKVYYNRDISAASQP